MIKTAVYFTPKLRIWGYVSEINRLNAVKRLLTSSCLQKLSAIAAMISIFLHRKRQIMSTGITRPVFVLAGEAI